MKIFVSGADDETIKTLNKHGFKTIVPELSLPNKQNIAIDPQNLNRVDAVLILGKPNWDSSGHFWYTCYITKKPTIVVTENAVSWLIWYATETVQTLEEAIKVLTIWKRKL